MKFVSIFLLASATSTLFSGKPPTRCSLRPFKTKCHYLEINPGPNFARYVRSTILLMTHQNNYGS